MARYVDGFVIPVPKRNRAAYMKMARVARDVWMELGALDYHECVADDVKPGKVTSFPQSVDLKPDETVFVGIASYASRAHRDEVSAKAMKDPRMAGMNAATMPFDAKRMFWGGFKPFVEA